jgi:hypothetical protein
MEIIQNALAKLLQEIKSPRGGRYLALGGILITIFGCIGIGIGNAVAQNSAKGSAGSVLAAIFLLITLLMVLVGVVITIIGGVMALIQNQKAKAQIAASNPPTFTSSNLNSVAPANKESQSVIAQPVTANGLSIDQRREILQREINKYLRQGYRVISQTDTTAQLVKPKVFSCLWFLINMILLIGWIFYLLWYWSKRDTQVYIEVDINGRVKIRK